MILLGVLSLLQNLKMIKSKKGSNILTENVIFIILNIVFLAVMIIFLFLKSGDVAPIEEKYAKEIALMIDAARPGMEISFEMGDAVEKAKKEKWDFNEIVSFDGNVVNVKLRENGGYEYSFFNDVTPSFDLNSRGEARLVIRSENE